MLPTAPLVSGANASFDVSLFPHFAPLLDACEAYAVGSGFRFRLSSFEKSFGCSADSDSDVGSTQADDDERDSSSEASTDTSLTAHSLAVDLVSQFRKRLRKTDGMQGSDKVSGPLGVGRVLHTVTMRAGEDLQSSSISEYEPGTHFIVLAQGEKGSGRRVFVQHALTAQKGWISKSTRGGDQLLEVTRWDSNLLEAEHGLVLDLDRAFQTVNEESVRSAMVGACKELGLFESHAEVEDYLSSHECDWENVSVSLPLIAQRLFEDDSRRRSKDANNERTQQRLLATATFLVDFADQAGVSLPQMSETHRKRLKSFRKRVKEWVAQTRSDANADCILMGLPFADDGEDDAMKAFAETWQAAVGAVASGAVAAAAAARTSATVVAAASEARRHSLTGALTTSWTWRSSCSQDVQAPQAETRRHSVS